MPHIGTLRDFRFKGDVDDIRGANLYGRGGDKLGKIDDVIFDHATGRINYLVVDTGGWLRSNRFLVPADRINNHAEDDRDFSCNLTKDQIERFPEYNDETVSDEKHWHEYESSYNKSFDVDGGVMHREGSNRTITPESHEMPMPASSGDDGIDSTPTRLVDRFKMPGDPMRDHTHIRPAGTAARAEDNKIPGRALTDREAAWSDPDEQAHAPEQFGSGARTEHLEVHDEPVRDFDRENVRDLGMNRRAGDRLEGSDVRSDEPEIDRDLNRKVASFSSREDIGDVDVDTSRPASGAPVISDPAAAENNPRSAYGDARRTVVPGSPNDPPSYQEHLNDAEDRRSGRLRDFEEHLRRNRVDITSSCRACDVEKNKDRAA